jgi:hypothetical protein
MTRQQVYNKYVVLRYICYVDRMIYLWRKRDGVAQLFKPTDMVPLEAGLLIPDVVQGTEASPENHPFSAPGGL